MLRELRDLTARMGSLVREHDDLRREGDEARLLQELEARLGPQVHQELEARLMPQVHTRLVGELEPAVRAELRSQLEPGVRAELEPVVRGLLAAELAPGVRARLAAEARERVEADCRGRLERECEARLRGQVKSYNTRQQCLFSGLRISFGILGSIPSQGWNFSAILRSALGPSSCGWCG